MNQQIIDSSGNVVPGLKRGMNGEIIVDDSLALNRFKAAQILERRVAENEQKISEMYSILLELMQHFSYKEKTQGNMNVS